MLNNCGSFLNGQPNILSLPNEATCSEVKLIGSFGCNLLYLDTARFNTFIRTVSLDILFDPVIEINTFSFWSTSTVTKLLAGTACSEIEDGVFTTTGSFCKKVDVNMKNVSKSTVTSLIAVMSMSVLFLLIFTLPIFTYFTFIYRLVSSSKRCTIEKPISSIAYVRLSILFVKKL